MVRHPDCSNPDWETCYEFGSMSNHNNTTNRCSGLLTPILLSWRCQCRQADANHSPKPTPPDSTALSDLTELCNRKCHMPCSAVGLPTASNPCANAIRPAATAQKCCAPQWNMARMRLIYSGASAPSAAALGDTRLLPRMARRTRSPASRSVVLIGATTDAMACMEAWIDE